MILSFTTKRPIIGTIKQPFNWSPIMPTTHPILADVSAGISELKKNPMAVMAQGEGSPVAILNRNEPVFYAVPASAYEAILDKLEDIELASIVRSRMDQSEVEVALDEL
jgi:antitoxin StbD